MRRLLTGGAMLGALLALAAAPCARAQESGLPVKPLTWPTDTQLEYGIYNNAGDRTATAYYRILKEKSNNKPLYHFKYMGRNDKMSESAEVWVEPDTLHPLRSTRKLVSGGRTLYVDVAYTPGKIVVRRKYAGEPVTEVDVPAQLPYFDFEELMWLPPQFAWTDKTPQAFLNYFNTFLFQPATTIVYRDGMDKIDVQGKSYPAIRYRFAVGSTQYSYWTVDQNGREVPAKVFMDDANDAREVTFLNLQLNLKAVKASPEAWKAKPLPPAQQNAMPSLPPGTLPPGLTPDQPLPSPPPPDVPGPGQPAPDQPGQGGDQPQPPPTPPDDNPFAPPPDGGQG
jgi:hypothetical protein